MAALVAGAGRCQPKAAQSRRGLDIDEPPVDHAPGRSVLERADCLRKGRIGEDGSVDQHGVLRRALGAAPGEDAPEKGVAAGHALRRTARTASSSRTVKGGKAPGKLAVARAAKTSSASDGQLPWPVAARGEADREAMLGLADLRRTVEQQRLLMTGKVRRGHEQVERMAVRDEGRPAFARRHGVAGIEQQVREARAGKGRRKPARADEVGELAPHFLARLGRHRPLDRVATPPQHQPEQRPRPEFGEAGEGRASGSMRTSESAARSHRSVSGSIDWPVLQRMGEEDAVDAAGAGACDDVRDDSQPQIGFGLCGLENIPIDGLAREAGTSSRFSPAVKSRLALARCQISLVTPCM